MADDKKAPSPPTRAELDAAVIRRVFKNNDKLLLSMRAVLLGLGANDAEKKMVHDAFKDAELFAAVKQRFLPEFRKDEALGNISEVWGGVEKMIFGYSRDTIEQALRYKERGIEMLTAAIPLLKNPDLPTPDLKVKIDIKNDPLGIEVLARQQYVKAVEEQLVGLKIVALQKEMTDAEKKEQATKDSTE